MEIWQQSLIGLSDFIIYFAVSLVLLLVFKWTYTLVTPHDEWRLVKEQHSVAAAIGLAGAVMGFCIALAGAVSNSASLVDFIIWGLIALIAQLLAFAVLRFTFMPKIAERISNDEVSAGVMLGSVSVAVGLLNAACMTY
jgi:putative membrane protein